jgi:hypothetical protein
MDIHVSEGSKKLLDRCLMSDVLDINEWMIFTLSYSAHTVNFSNKQGKKKI